MSQIFDISVANYVIAKTQQQNLNLKWHEMHDEVTFCSFAGSYFPEKKIILSGCYLFLIESEAHQKTGKNTLNH